jgi:hypothetical protein
MTDDLVQFLRDRLNEDEAHALSASNGQPRCATWSLDEWFGREEPHSLIAVGTETQPVVLGHFTADPLPTAQAAHIARHDPARVLREVEAKRGVLNQYEDVREQVRNPVSAENRHSARIEQGTLGDVMRLLALPYAGHLDFRDEWRP